MVRSRCKDAACCPEPRLGWDRLDEISQLPDPVLDSTGEHYLKFDEVYGKTCMPAAKPPSSEPILKVKKKNQKVNIFYTLWVYATITL